MNVDEVLDGLAVQHGRDFNTLVLAQGAELVELGMNNGEALAFNRTFRHLLDRVLEVRDDVGAERFRNLEEGHRAFAAFDAELTLLAKKRASKCMIILDHFSALRCSVPLTWKAR